jgi:esterase/lipase superfamily enzyme
MSCEVRAYELVPNGGPHVPGMSSDGMSSDGMSSDGWSDRPIFSHPTPGSGELIEHAVRTTIARREGCDVTHESLWLPYTDMLLPCGRHMIYYTIQCMDGDELVFQATTDPHLACIDATSEQVQSTNATIDGPSCETGLLPRITEDGTVESIHEVSLNTTGYRVSRPFDSIQGVGVFGVDDDPSLSVWRSDDDAHGLSVKNVIGDVAPRVSLSRPTVQSPVPQRKAWSPEPNVLVYYATNRQIDTQGGLKVGSFGNKLSQSLSYGQTSVSIPVGVHHRGSLERPWFFQRPDPLKHFLVEAVTALEQDVFLRTMRSLVGEQGQDTFVFVHGFNVSFEWSILTAARLKHDIRFAGPMLAFSWASEGRSFDLLNPSGPYRRDEAKAAASVDQLVTFLSELDAQRRDQGQPGRIHLLAHSMGNRVLLGALERLSLRETDAAKFGHVIFAAPDVDATTFVNQFQRAHRLVESTTLYFCDEDQALKLSQRINNDSRVGQKPIYLAPPRFVPPLHVIDCAKANTSWLGHGYITDRDILLVDLEMLINLNRKPDDRCPPLVPGLIPAVADRPLWLFP